MIPTPRIQPKPRRPKRKRVTLIVSMRAKHGAIVLSDSQETVKDRDGNEFKYAVLKSEPESVRGFKYVIAGGGDGPAIDELCETFRRSLAVSKCKTLNDFRLLLEAHLARELRAIQKLDPASRIELLVAAARGKKWEVWRNARETLIKTTESVPTLVGFDAEIYKHLAAELFPRAKSTPQFLLVGLRILELARQSSTCVNSPYHGVLIVPNVVTKISSKVLGELTESVTTFGAYLDQLLLTSADTSVNKKEFTRIIEEFTKSAIHLRNDYLQAIAQAEAHAELIEGIPSLLGLMPRPSIRTIGVGSGGITAHVEESDFQIKPSASRTSEPEK